MYRVSTFRLTSLATAITLTAALAGGCARPQTFADPSAQLYQPPVVSTGMDSSGSSAPLYDNGTGSYGGGYAPPGQSYDYGAQAPSTDAGYSQAEMKEMYEKYYGGGQSTSITPNTNPPATYPGGSTQANGGESVTTQRPESSPPQNPINDPQSALRNNDDASGGSQSSGSGTSPSNGQARPMVPIQRGSVGGNGNDGGRTTSLQGSPAQDPAAGMTNPPRSTDLSGATAGRSQQDLNSNSPATGWPYTLAPGGNYPRQRVPLESTPGSSTAGSSTPADPSPAVIDPSGGNTAGTSAAGQATPRLQPPTASPVSSTPGDSKYPPGGQWPQKPIPLPRESS